MLPIAPQPSSSIRPFGVRQIRYRATLSARVTCVANSGCSTRNSKTSWRATNDSPCTRVATAGPPPRGRRSGMLLQYLYAVVEGLPPGWRPPPPVVGERVERHSLTGLVVLRNAVSTVPPATPTTLALHHDVVASALDADGLVPFRYGTVVRAADVDGWLTRERPALEGALASVRG